MIGKFVIVRTINAGIHCGYLKELVETNGLINECRRLWRWRGARTLNELSLYGAAQEYTRLSEPVEEVLLTQCIEIIPCTKVAMENLKQSRWSE